MAENGVPLQTFNMELVKSIEELKKKQKNLELIIEEEEREKLVLQREIEKLSYRLTMINESLLKKITVRNDYERTIAESEAAYNKIVESSKVLLGMVHREAACLEENSAKKIASTDSGEI